MRGLIDTVWAVFVAEFWARCGSIAAKKAAGVCADCKLAKCQIMKTGRSLPQS